MTGQPMHPRVRRLDRPAPRLPSPASRGTFDCRKRAAERASRTRSPSVSSPEPTGPEPSCARRSDTPTLFSLETGATLASSRQILAVRGQLRDTGSRDLPRPDGIFIASSGSAWKGTHRARSMR
jgi:hypothetical protein